VKLSIVIACYNRWNFTKSALNDLAKLPNDHQVIVVDNASTDETKIELDKFCEEHKNNTANCEIICVHNSENLFHSKACNQGFKLATGENILFINNDVRIKSATWTEIVIKSCQTTNGLVGPTMGLLDNNLNFVKEANHQLTGNCYLGGWCIAAKKEVWEKLRISDTDQIWNEELPFYFNDGDLSFRGRQKNIPLTVIPLPEIVHFGKVSAQQINVQKLYHEGRKVFIQKWGKK
jgi:GT2 family glycosyltransferase